MQWKTCSDLPPECLLNIIGYLDSPDVASLLRTSKCWNSVIVSNETTIYRQLANIYDSRAGYKSSHRLRDALRSWASPSAATIKTWKQYCHLQVTTERRWKLDGIPDCRFFQGLALEKAIQNIQIDLEKSLLLRTIATRSERAGPIVICLLDPMQPTLFRLNMTFPIYQAELSNGFLVCSRFMAEELSIWRWADDQRQDPIVCEPSAGQIDIYQAREIAGFQTDVPSRGELVPVGIIQSPESAIHAFRLVYPVLCVGTLEMISIWEVRSRSCIQTIATHPSILFGRQLFAVDVNDTHVFVARGQVQVYSRITGQLIFELRADFLELSNSCVALPSLRRQSGDFEEYALAEFLQPATPLAHPHPNAQLYSDSATGVYSSPTGDNFVATTANGIIYVEFVDSIHSQIRDGLNPWHVTTNALDDGGHSATALGSPSPADNFRISITRLQKKIWKAAYDGHKIVALGSEGLSILHIDNQAGPAITVSMADGPSHLIYPFPATNMYHIPAFRFLSDREYTCIKLTRDTCWLACGFRAGIGSVDFAQEFRADDHTWD
ncbi:unnamed protein product [Rhizoctonia solani]|uniref:F-box domain-containing protein n=1 Tax=Rhizoctonia solani TaxID=456999 RepID=A0A8H3H947_9AGAM|nr:unnamed protein product [Rhizoctonia solani]